MGYREGDRTYEFEAKILHQTEKAYKIENVVFGETWLPKSQIASMSEADDRGNIQFVVAEWWAEKAGVL